MAVIAALLSQWYCLSALSRRKGRYPVVLTLSFQRGSPFFTENFPALQVDIDQEIKWPTAANEASPRGKLNTISRWLRVLPANAFIPRGVAQYFSFPSRDSLLRLILPEESTQTSYFPPRGVEVSLISATRECEVSWEVCRNLHTGYRRSTCRRVSWNVEFLWGIAETDSEPFRVRVKVCTKLRDRSQCRYVWCKFVTSWTHVHTWQG